jgi:glutamine synthetase
VLTAEELKSRYEILTEHYKHTIEIEIRLMVELFKTMVLPAAIQHQKTLSDSIIACESVRKGGKLKSQRESLNSLADEIEAAITVCDKLDKALEKAASLELSKSAEALCEKALPLMEAFRASVDRIETMVDDSLWPLPKYRELLFII